MAMMKYGAVVKKNKKIIQEDMFMDMKNSVGFELKNAILNDGTTIQINENYFSYIGDKKLLVCVYKEMLVFVSGNKVIHIQNGLWINEQLPYMLQKLDLTINNINFRIRRLGAGKNRYKLRFIYKNNIYECLYGQGVNVDKNAWYDMSSSERNYVNKWFIDNN